MSFFFLKDPIISIFKKEINQSFFFITILERIRDFTNCWLKAQSAKYVLSAL